MRKPQWESDPPQFLLQHSDVGVVHLHFAFRSLLPESARRALLIRQREGRDGRWRIRQTFRGGAGAAWDTAERRVLQGLAVWDLCDVFRLVNGYKAMDFSWLLDRKGQTFKYRFDHIFASAQLRPISCEYVHDLRTHGLSDHSPILGDFERLRSAARQLITQRKAKSVGCYSCDNLANYASARLGMLGREIKVTQSAHLSRLFTGSYRFGVRGYPDRAVVFLNDTGETIYRRYSVVDATMVHKRGWEDPHALHQSAMDATKRGPPAEQAGGPA